MIHTKMEANPKGRSLLFAQRNKKARLILNDKKYKFKQKTFYSCHLVSIQIKSLDRRDVALVQ